MGGSMGYGLQRSDHFLRNGAFLLFVTGQAVSGLGDAMHFVAVTGTLVRITGSGTYAGFGLILVPVLGILLSPLAGVLGDRYDEMRMLVLLDAARGLTAVLFAFADSVAALYLLMAALSSLDLLYGPPRRKYVLRFLRRRELLQGNSLLLCSSGAAYIIGPAAGGMIASFYGSGAVFFFNGMTFFLSALVIAVSGFLQAPVRPRKTSLPISCRTGGGPAKGPERNGIGSLQEAWRYLLSQRDLRRLVMLGTAVCLCSSAVNMAFYPYFFDVLHAGERDWALAVVIFNCAGLLSMLYPLLLGADAREGGLRRLFHILLAVSSVWIGYGLCGRLPVVFPIMLFEGVGLSLFWMIAGTAIQELCRRDCMARIAGLNDLVNNVGRMAGSGITLLLLRVASPADLFIPAAGLLLLCAFVLTGRDG